MKPMFAVQVTGRPDQDLQKTFDALRAGGHDFDNFGVIPFEEENPVTNVDAFPTNRPVIVLGGTRCVKLHEQDKLPPNWRMFYHPKFFDQREYRHLFGNALLNAFATYTQFGVGQYMVHEVSTFVKPVNDLKSFAGLVLEPGQSLNTALKSQTHQQIDDDEWIMFTSVRHIEREWRVFMVNGKAVAGSQYRDRHGIKHAPFANHFEWNAVRSFAEVLHEEQMRKHVPVYTMDVCETDRGLRIVELNCFNCSGMYESDRVALFNAVAKLV